MKKFLALSAVIAVAGLGIGIASRGGSDGQPVQMAITTSTTVTVAAQPTPTTIAPKVATKVATKATTATTGRVAPPVAVVATTSTTRTAVTTTAPAPTTTTTTGPTPTCTVTMASPSTHYGDSQEARVASNMPATKTRITVHYPKFGRPNRTQTFVLTTDGAGVAVQSFNVIDTSTEPVGVSVEFYNAAGYAIWACQTTFTSN